MKNQTNISKSILVVAVVTLVILMVPLIAMQFTDEVNWSPADFILMAVLLFGTGITYVLITNYLPGIVYRIAIAFALGTTFLMIWANLAVGLIGAGPHAGNLMYIGVIAVGIIGIILSRFKPLGMERTMYAMAFALVLLAVIALLTNMHQYAGTSIKEIIGVNGFFALLYVIAGFLFNQKLSAIKEMKS